MQLRSPAPTRAPRLVSLGVVSLFATLAILLSGCQPRTQLEQVDSDVSRGQTSVNAVGTNKPLADKPLTIVALGDSYSSGEGNAPFDLDAASCGRGANAWPRLLGQEIAGSTVRLLACSGAKTTAFTTSFHGQPPQVEALRALVASGVKPDIVTITIGGNDAGFGSTIVSCVVWRCFWTGHDDNKRKYVTKQLPSLLKTAYSQVKAAAGGARVVVVGYPDLFPSSTANICKWLDNNERVQLAGLNNDLNRVIRRAASQSDVDFLSINRVFDDHKLCTKDPWVYPVGLTGAGLEASGHPNASGQRAIADAVHAYISKSK
ncbi:SGNH/GDSL hydrolase family protein [Pseudofrankia saprophytica]|uniref:SGNH/GDSL hydrolase family protein n=1 Tax=Pseudofrankia saprophytica TaxID=298655 RepID=UPI000234D5CF|nr:SGNH/GDSL hydrolase family protein [Pseudofrankia saprophytica]